MKKFSWIFALILALSMAFIGCPADDGDDDSGGGGGGGGGGGFYDKNPDAQDITVTFGSGPNDTLIKKNGDNSGPIDPGTLTYINAAGVTVTSGGVGYEYTYGSAANTNYGNAVLRFKLTLADGICLADYGKVSFDWQAKAPLYNNGNSVNSSKNLFLFATETEAEITPYIEPKNKVVSTNVFQDNPGLDWYAGAVRTNDPNVPQVNGLESHHIEMPIIANETTTYIEGNVWFAIYLHAEGGTYQIKNIKFWAGDQTLNCDGPKGAAPPPPLVTVVPPAKAQKTTITLDTTNTAEVGTGGEEAGTVITAATPGVDVAFSKNNQRLNIPLGSTLVQALKDSKGTNASADVWIQINGTSLTSTGQYRFYLGVINTGANWNAAGISNSYDFDGQDLEGTDVGIAGRILKISYDGNANNSGNTSPDYFIIRYYGSTASTVNIESIDIWVLPPPPPKADITFTDVSDIGVKNGTVELLEDGIGYTVTMEQGYSWTYTYFTVTLPAGKKLSDYSKVAFTTKSITQDGLEDGSGYKAGWMNAYAVGTDVTNLGELKNATANYIFGVAAGGSATGIGAPDVDGTKNVDIKAPLPVAVPDANSFIIVYATGGSAGYVYEFKNISFY